MSELYEDRADAPRDQIPQIVLVVTNFPDADSARNAAGTLVTDGLAACVNVMSPCHSVYSWDGAIQQDMEIPVWFKTTQEAATRLMARVKQLHPHEVPELLVLRPQDVQADYAQWVQRAIG